ncbi:MAG: glutaminyl-peptide cyclotransferase [Ignavibacteria bacterium]|nr:glutaminyl-peptide cyclotransferase [Ignavibacteria bacterium]
MKIRIVFLIYNIVILCIFPFVLTSCSSEQKESSFKENKSFSQNESKKEEKTELDQKEEIALKTKHYKAKVVRTFPHDSSAFTQGFLFHNGSLFESTGLKFLSTLKQIDLEHNKVLKSISIPGNYFAEGIAIVGNKIYLLTWESNTCLVYDLKTFKEITTFNYYGEGWGLTFDGNSLIMSDGTNNLRFVSPEDFQILRTLSVQDGNRPIHNLNELEYINGEIWANVWMSDNIVKIDPNNGKVLAWIDLGSLYDYIDKERRIDVLNGIAFDKETKRIFVTGKLWPLIFEITIEEIK